MRLLERPQKTPGNSHPRDQLASLLSVHRADGGASLSSTAVSAGGDGRVL